MTKLISCRIGFLLSCFYKSNSSYLFCKLWLCQVLIAAGAFLTDVDRFPWKNQSEFCVVRAAHKFKSLDFVCGPSFFSLPAACCLFSLALLSLRKNGGLLVVYRRPSFRNKKKERQFSLRLSCSTFYSDTKSWLGDVSLFKFPARPIKLFKNNF